MSQFLETPRNERALVVGADFEKTVLGLYVPKRPKPRSPWPTHVDLFAGAGGFGCGVAQAGFHTIAANEYDPHAAITWTVNLGTYPMNLHWVEPEDEERLETVLFRQIRAWYKKKTGANISSLDDIAPEHILEIPVTTGSGWIAAHRDHTPANCPSRHNHDDDDSARWFCEQYHDGPPAGLPGCRDFFFGDARKLTGQMIFDATGYGPGEIDLVTGGPPCQGYSIAGNRNVYDPRSSLTFEFVRLVLELQPKSFAMENVPGILAMVTPEGEPVMDAVCRIIEEGDYASFEATRRMLLHSSGFGHRAKKKLAYGRQARGKSSYDANATDDEEAEEQPALF